MKNLMYLFVAGTMFVLTACSGGGTTEEAVVEEAVVEDAVVEEAVVEEVDTTAKEETAE